MMMNRGGPLGKPAAETLCYAGIGSAFVINAKTAPTLGIAVPRDLLVQATEIIR